MLYKYKDFVYDYDYGTGKLYKGDRLIFKGNGWSGILFFLSATKNAPEVKSMFQQQLDTREGYDDTCIFTCGNIRIRRHC